MYFPSALLFVSQSIETQEETGFKTNSKVLHSLTQHPQQGKLFREEQNVDQRGGSPYKDRISVKKHCSKALMKSCWLLFRTEGFPDKIIILPQVR